MPQWSWCYWPQEGMFDAKVWQRLRPGPEFPEDGYAYNSVATAYVDQTGVRQEVYEVSRVKLPPPQRAPSVSRGVRPELSARLAALEQDQRIRLFVRLDVPDKPRVPAVPKYGELPIDDIERIRDE